MKVLDAKPQSRRSSDETTAGNQESRAGLGTVPVCGDDASLEVGAMREAEPTDMRDIPIIQSAHPDRLSSRAENVLKMLAVELTGEEPPPGRWVPSDLLLQRLTYRHLATARNCGPQTTAEIIAWAQARGAPIRRSFRAGKSLSAMWQQILAKCSAGEVSKAEIAEALENSTRRRNTRIPVGLQKVLLQLIRSSNE